MGAVIILSLDPPLIPTPPPPTGLVLPKPTGEGDGELLFGEGIPSVELLLLLAASAVAACGW